MKKSFGLYIAGWLAALGLFNVVAFVTPNEVNGVSKFDTLFWVAYAFITLFFVGQLVCAYVALSGDSLKKTFYNFSLIGVSISALIAMLVVGGLCMAVIQIPDWIGIIACSIVMTVSVIAVVKATVAVAAVTEVDKKIKTKTLFVRMLTADAQALVAKAETPELRAVAGKVYEAIRYSDPMSDPALNAVEEKISDEFKRLSDAVEGKDQEAAENSSRSILALISERNVKCKVLK